MIILSYAGPLGLVALSSTPSSDEVRFHARQGLALFGCLIAVLLLAFVPLVGYALFFLGWLAYLAVAGIALFRALKGELWRIPGVWTLVERLWR